MSDDLDKPKKGPRWAKIALGVSLSLNLLVAGLAIGTFSNVKKNGGPMRPGEAAGAYTYALSPQDRRSIGKAISERNRSGDKTRDQIVAEYQNMIDVLTADEFDREAARQILDRQFNFANERRLDSESLLLDHLDTLSLEERKAFAERLQEGAKRRPGKPPPRQRN